MLVLVCVLIALVSARINRAKYSAELKNCPKDRNEAVICAEKYGDANRNRLLELSEVIKLKSNMLHWWEKMIDWKNPTDQIFTHCKPGYISGVTKINLNDTSYGIGEKDFDDTLATCLRDCRAVMDFFYYICDRAKAMNYDPTSDVAPEGSIADRKNKLKK